MLSKGQSLVFIKSFNLLDVYDKLLLSEVIPILLFAPIFLKIFKGSKWSLDSKAGIILRAGCLISIVSVLFIAFISIPAEGSFFIDRYLFPLVLGNILIFSGILAFTSPIFIYLLVPILMMIQSGFFLFKLDKRSERPHPWKLITEEEDGTSWKDCFLLNVSEYIESINLDLIKDSRYYSYFHSPFVAYPIPNIVINLPRAYLKKDENKIKKMFKQYKKLNCLITIEPERELRALKARNFKQTKDLVSTEVRKNRFKMIHNKRQVGVRMRYYKKKFR